MSIPRLGQQNIPSQSASNETEPTVHQQERLHEVAQTETSIVQYDDGGGARLRQERRLEGDVRRAELDRHPGLTSGRSGEENRRIMRGVQNGTVTIPQSQSGPLRPPSAQLPHPEYDYRHVSGGGIFSRGPDSTLENQHSQNMSIANRYGGQYERYTNEYTRRVNQAQSFQELQSLGPHRSPEQFNPGTRGVAESTRQQQQMTGLRNEFNRVNNQTSSAELRAMDAVANRARQLRGEEPHGPNLNVDINPGDLIPNTDAAVHTTIDRDGVRGSVSAEHETRIGRNLRVRSEVNSQGEITGEVSVRVPGARVRVERSQDQRGDVQTTVGGRFGSRGTGIGVEAGTDSHVGVEVTQGGVTAGTSVNPNAGTFDFSVELPVPRTEEGSVRLTFGFRGLSQEDAERIGRALSSSRGFFDLPPEAIRAMDRRYGRE